MLRGLSLFISLSILVVSLSGCDSDPSGPTENPPVCEPIAATRVCTAGPTQGVCVRGEQSCWGTNWSPCFGEILPESEVCDGLDNDCDGVIDNGVVNACGGCGKLPEEICDGIDNNCNGAIDEGFSLIPEDCNGIDDNCNGSIDEGLSKRNQCEPLGAEGWVIYHQDDPKSACRMGWRTCVQGFGQWSECFGWIGPEPEICDGIDNDCDGELDEIDEEPESCGYTEEGVCALGRPLCVDNDLVCYGGISPGPEVCDGLDNDCDGEVDEELVQECESECEKGLATCVDGAWVDCTARLPSPERCDEVDNDCDGAVDEGILCFCIEESLQPCVAPTCGWGLQQCTEGAWGICAGEVPQPEMCNRHDDNCNGEVDEDLQQECYEGDFTQIGVGLCRAGYATCSDGSWGTCVNQVLPDLEFCDGLDNDCDGLVDNLERVFDKVDLVFALDVSGSMGVFVTGIVSAISNFALALQGTEHQFSLVIYGSDQRGAAQKVIPLSDLASFIDALGQSYTPGSLEPDLDVVYQIADPVNFLGFNWRVDATPMLVLAGDEEMQSQMSIPTTLADVRTFTDVCQLPGCNNATNPSWVDGDPFEIFVFTLASHMVPWRMLIAAEGTRVFDLIAANDEQRLAADLSLIFREFCLDPELTP